MTRLAARGSYFSATTGRQASDQPRRPIAAATVASRTSAYSGARFVAALASDLK